MNITLTNLEALILKATHESLPQPDAAALEAFCVVLRDSAEGPQLAAQALAARIHTQNPKEALLALIMLDKCMRQCDGAFHAEVGKFRFLNEMIKLVSPKYFANRTAPEVRTRILQSLHAWSFDYPKETKFKVAFDMLKNQGVVKETPPPLPPEETPSISRNRAKSAIFENEEKSKLLQKLLQSKKPEDLQHANRLIKTMVREEERRTEANSRRAQEVSAALDSAGLLLDLLENAADASPDEEQLIHELHASCLRLRPVLQHLASSDTQADNLSKKMTIEEKLLKLVLIFMTRKLALSLHTNFRDILHANDVLDEVFGKYNTFVKEKKMKDKIFKRNSQAANSVSLLDFAGAEPCENSRGKVTTKPTNHNEVADLGDIFSNNAIAKNIAEPIKPVTLMTNEDSSDIEKHKKVEGWHELDSLGEQLLKQSLPENTKRVDSFISKHVKKIPMNALEKASPHHEVQAQTSALLDLDFFTKTPEPQTKVSPPAHSSIPMTSNDDLMVDISSEVTNGSESSFNNNLYSDMNTFDTNILDLNITPESDAKNVNIITTVDNKENDMTEIKDTVKYKAYGVKSMSDINVTLESVHPSKVPPLTAFEDKEGVAVVLHFCKDKPRPDVNVIVISTTSKHTSPIEDYKFHGVVPKGCKVRLLAPSGSALPASTPFRPPAALTQLMLVARPALAPVDLKFVLTYSCDGEVCSEMGEVKNLPLDDIK